jgi:type III secretion protein R
MMRKNSPRFSIKNNIAPLRLFAFLLGALCFATNAFAQTATQTATPATAARAAASPTAAAGQDVLSAGTANPIVLIIVIGALALAPFALIMLTSFVKIAVVLSILRNALGASSIPPNSIVTGISLILTIFIMSPVIEKMYGAAGAEITLSEASLARAFDVAERGREPLRQFLERHANERDRALFLDLARRMAIRNGTNPEEIQPTDFRVVVPGFVTSQLTEAFRIGFLLFIPFLVIDMVVANILQAMGMFMLSPTQISLPFKLLLFVLVDGWALLLKNLVLGYV